MASFLFPPQQVAQNDFSLAGDPVSQHGARRAALLRPLTQPFCLRGVLTTSDNVEVGLSLLYVRQARPLLRRSLGQQLSLVINQYEILKVGRDPDQLEGNSRSKLHMRDISRGILAAAVGARRP